ncbi:hypothetical protein BC834DRAFT_1040782, partial [Gloeopeniophorella convolvens]
MVEKGPKIMRSAGACTLSGLIARGIFSNLLLTTTVPLFKVGSVSYTMMAAVPPQDTTPTLPKDMSASKGEPSALAQPATRHDEFYFTDEMTVFQVGDRLFRVHQHFLAENSLVFSSMFSLPAAAPTPAPPEGTSDANPILLSGVTEHEFETLLRYFYKSMHDGFALPQASWIALLSIAHHFDFPNVRARAVREVFAAPGAQAPDAPDLLLLVAVAERYDVPPGTVLPALAALVARPAPLSEAEVARSTALTVSRLAAAREEFVRRTAGPAPQPLGLAPWLGGERGWKEDAAREIVRKIWVIPTRSRARLAAGSRRCEVPGGGAGGLARAGASRAAESRSCVVGFSGPALSLYHMLCIFWNLGTRPSSCSFASSRKPSHGE